MRKLLILFFLLIIAVAGADEICSAEQDFYSVYTITWDSFYSRNNLWGTSLIYTPQYRLEASQYLPSYIYMKCYTNCYNEYRIVYKVPDNQNACSIEYTTRNVGMSGSITAGGEVVGGFTVYVYDSSKELYFYAVYTKYKPGVVHYYNVTSSWPITSAQYCWKGPAERYYVAQTSTSLNITLPGYVSAIKVVEGSSATTLLAHSLVGNTGSGTTSQMYAFIRFYGFAGARLNISYNKDANLVNIKATNITANIIFKNKNFEFTMARGMTYDFMFVPQSSKIELYEGSKQVKIGEFDLGSLLSCYTQQTPETAELRVYGNGGVPIKDYKVIVNDYMELITTNYTVDLSAFVGQQINISILPLFNPALRENKTLNVVAGVNTLNLSNYYYALRISTYYKSINLMPLGFNYLIDGIMKPDKTNELSNLMYGGTAFDNQTLIVPAGLYNVTVNATVLGIQRSKNIELSLLDNNYYRHLTFLFGVVGEEVQEGYAISPILTIIILDQNNNYVNNATVKLFKQNELVSELLTNKGYVRFAGLELGQTYTVKVYVAGNLKATKTITLVDTAQTEIITITLTESEQSQIIVTTPETPETSVNVSNVTQALLSNTAVWGLVIVIALAIIAAANAGERIGLITFVAALGVFTYIIPLLSSVIFIIVAIIAMILFSWKIAGRFVGGGEE